MNTLKHWNNQIEILEHHIIVAAEISLALDTAIDELKKSDFPRHTILKVKADEMQKRAIAAFDKMMKTKQSP